VQPIRTIIRQALIEQLQSSQLLKAQVSAEQHLPIALQALPLITISLDKANIIEDWSAMNPAGNLLQMIEQPIVIKITATANDKLEEKLEQLAAEVNQTLAKNETLGGLVKSLRLDEDAELLISHEGEQSIGVLTMRFIALYRRPTLQLNKTCD
jgi:hypothetical protein